MNFTYFKQLINNLPNDTQYLRLIDNTTGHEFIFDIAINEELLVEETEIMAHYTLKFESKGI